MKRVLLGSIPILAALVLLINFMGDGVKTAHAVIAFDVQKENPVPGSGPTSVKTEWGNFGTVFTVTITDTSLINAVDGNVIDVQIESDQFDSEDLTFNNVLEGDANGNGAIDDANNDSGVFIVTFTLDADATSADTGGAGADGLVLAGDGTQHVDDDDSFLIIYHVDNPAGAVASGAERASAEIEVENKIPDIKGLDPSDGDVIDDTRVDFSVDVTDSDSGIPTPEDLPDSDTDDEYTTTLFLIGDTQCSDDELNSDMTVAEILAADCNGAAAGGGITTWEIADENDFDDIDNGFSVDTRITLSEGRNYITVLAFDAAGNYRVLDVDRSDEDVVMAEITVDENEPEIDSIRTGVAWDSADDEYDKNKRDWMQIVFDDATDLDPNSIQRTDVIVEGHDVRRVQWYDIDPEDVGGFEDFDGTPFVCTEIGDVTTVVDCDTTPADGKIDDGAEIVHPQDGGADVNMAAFIRRTVFIQLEDELEPDETPDVNIVPNGIDDEAGNTQDSTDDEALDKIAPDFTVLELTGPIADKLLAGEDDEMEMIITSDEDLDDDPAVTVTYVDAPIGCEVGGAGADACPFGVGSTLTTNVDEIGRNRWRVTINDPNDTGYYNIYIAGDDSEGNTGDQGIAPADLEDDFFKDNGDVNTDDAIFFQGDIDLPDPLISIAGESDPGEYEDSVEFRNPFFIELNFKSPAFDADDNPAGADFDPLDEDGEYKKDTFDDVEITLFELDGVDMTDQVSSTDKQRFLIAIDNIALGDHTIAVEARDEAGNEFADDVEADFTVEERAAFELEVRPGWNLFSLPGAPADGAIDTVFGPGVPVTTLYTFDPTVPGGWLVAVRETSDDPWTGSLMEIDPTRGYWGLSNAIFEVDVDVPRIAGGSAGGGTPVQPPTVDLFPGWNLVPVIDVTGDAEFEDTVDADVYFGGVRSAVRQIVTFNTITNVWETVPFFEDILLDNDGNAAVAGSPTTDELLDDPDLSFGKAYWVFATEEATLVPGSR